MAPHGDLALLAVGAAEDLVEKMRRADKFGGTAAAVDDPTIQQLAAAACTSMEQLVHQPHGA